MRRYFRARFPKEDHPDLASHIKSGEEGRDGQHPIDRGIMFVGVEQDFILGPEACKRENTRQSDRADQIKPKADFHFVTQAAHVAHIAWVEDFAVRIPVRKMMMTA